jgi:hypothetical protein
MKYAVSYVSGCAGDFVVNCCNGCWDLGTTEHGTVISSASVKKQDSSLNDADWLKLVNNFSESYIGTHVVDRLLRLPVIPLWLVVPDIKSYYIWARRDCVTRDYKKLLAPSGDFFLTIRELVLTNKSIQAAELYLDWITNYNWVLNQMRLVQKSNKIDISDLLDYRGIDSIIDQISYLQTNVSQCQQYHNMWLRNQLDLSEPSVINLLSVKLSKFVNENL